MLVPFKILFALIYDLFLLAAVWFVSAIPFVVWQGSDFAQQPFTLLAFQLYIIGITYLYLTFFWMNSGQTPGLRTWKLRLVKDDGFLLTRTQASFRFIMIMLFCLIGWITLFTPKKQLLQDIASQTKIIPVEDDHT